jgi:hypothetical protein
MGFVMMDMFRSMTVEIENEKGKYNELYIEIR